MDWILGLASFWGIVWTLIAIFAISVSVEWEQGLIALGLVFVALFIPFWWSDSDLGLLTWVRAHPGQTAGLVVLYVVVGVLWALVKWRIYVYDRRDSVRDDYNGYYVQTYDRDGIKKGEIQPGSPTFEQFVESDRNPLAPSRHRERILRWMAWWPFSALSTLLSDFVARLWRRLYSLTERAFVAVMRAGVR